MGHPYGMRIIFAGAVKLGNYPEIYVLGCLRRTVRKWGGA